MIRFARAVCITLLPAICACAARDSVTHDSTTPDSARTRATNTPAALPAGEAELAVPGGQLWYKVSGTGSGTPVILIHGGPGFSSYYFKPLEALGDDRHVVRYDQVGSGKSGPLTDTSMFNIAHFVNELDSLRAHLGYDRVYLLGHSWGTIVALEYYRAHPEHVAGMVMGSAFIDLPAWTRNGRRFIKALPDSMQRAIAKHEADKNYDAPDYQAATMA